MEKILKAIGVSVAFSGAIILLVPLNILFGYFAGFIIKIFCGNLFANGLNLLFGTNRFSPESIPMLTATMSVLGTYLRTSVKHDKD